MSDTPADERTTKLDAALARNQREERDERNADIERQQRADEEIVRRLAERDQQA